MKWIPLHKARKLTIDTPVFTRNDADEYGLGKLVKIEKTAEGTVHTFEAAQFAGDQPPSVKATMVTNITAVAIPDTQTSDKAPRKKKAVAIP